MRDILNKIGPYFLFIALLTVSIISKLLSADTSLWQDEGGTIFYSQQGLAAIFERTTREPNPPPHYILLFFWNSLFEVSAFSSRAMSIFFHSIGAIFFFKSITLLSKNTWNAAILSTLFLFSNGLSGFAVEARTYALEHMLISLSLYSFMQYYLGGGGGKLKWLILSAVMNSVMMFSHYLSVFVPLSQFLFLVFHFDKKKIKDAFVFGTISLLLFSPWTYFVFINMPEKGSFWLQVPKWDDLHFMIERVVPLQSNFHYTTISISVIGTLLLSFNKIISPEKRNLSTFFILSTIGIIIATYIIAQFRPIFLAKYLMYLNIYILFFISIFWIEVKNLFPKISYASLGIYLCIVLLNYSWSIVKSENWESAVEYLEQNSNSNSNGTILFEHYTHRPFSYYYNNNAFQSPKTVEFDLRKDHVFSLNHKQAIQDSIIKLDIIHVIKRGELDKSAIKKLNENAFHNAWKQVNIKNFRGLSIARFERIDD